MEDSAPFFGYSFLEPAQGDGSESLGKGGGGGFERACKAAKFNFSQEVFFNEKGMLIG